METIIFLFDNAAKIYKVQSSSKQKTLKQKKIPWVYEMFQEFLQLITSEKRGLNGYVYHLSVHYRAFDTSNIINIHKYLMKKHGIK